MNIIKLAIVGYGGMGSKHPWYLKGNEMIEIAGVYDIDPARLEAGKNDGYRPYASYEELLADPEIELITCAVPNDQHLDVCVKAMKAGKNVLCEKPVAMSSKDLQTMIDTANECGVLFTVHQNRRWDKDFVIAKKIVDDNLLGNVFCIESRVQGSRGIPGDWRNRKECGGGMVFDWGIHLFDQMFLIMGDHKVKSVYCDLSYVTNEECDDGFKVIAKFDNGTEFHAEVGTSNFINLPRWYLLGENGSAVISDWDCSGRIVKVSDWENRDAVPVETAAGWTKTMAPRSEDTITTYPLPEVSTNARDFYRNIAKTIRGEEEILVTHKQIMRTMKFMEACFYSYEHRCVVTDFE